MKCGLLGKKLGHSYSPQIHSYLGAYSYTLFEKTPEELGDFLQHGDFAGLNVTMPYKKEVIPFCTELTERAAMLGAVNTIVRKCNGGLIGHNTDYFGFQSMLKRSGLQVSGKKVLVLGSGGASATAAAVLRESGACVVVVSRNGENNYHNLEKHADAAAIVNATPVGMYPHTGASAVDLDAFSSLEGVLDVIYNPAKTKLLMDAERKGIVTENGLWMLVAQAKESAEWFLGKSINDSEIGRIHRILQRQMENIVLIGMPGSGKTTIGQALAAQLGRRFIDTDAEIVRQTGKTIPAIFEDQGEEAFRRMETQVLAQLGRESGCIIATGGGCVTRSDNYPLLHQNGRIFWIKRDIRALPTDGRPLSQRNSLEAMYASREPMYRAFADHIISNEGNVTDTVKEILSMEGYL